MAWWPWGRKKENQPPPGQRRSKTYNIGGMDITLQDARPDISWEISGLPNVQDVIRYIQATLEAALKNEGCEYSYSGAQSPTLVYSNSMRVHIHAPPAKTINFEILDKILTDMERTIPSKEALDDFVARHKLTSLHREDQHESARLRRKVQPYADAAEKFYAEHGVTLTPEDRTELLERMVEAKSRQRN